MLARLRSGRQQAAVAELSRTAAWPSMLDRVKTRTLFAIPRSSF
jgi:hypothetical protein